LKDVGSVCTPAAGVNRMRADCEWIVSQGNGSRRTYTTKLIIARPL